MQTQSTSTVTTANRADVLRLTWQLVKSAKLSFGKALKQAWATIKLKAQMLIKPVSFFYVKDDGSLRFAVGHFSAAPTTTGNGKPASGTPKPGNPLAIRYFDTLANGWRSFRADRLLID